MAAGRDIDETDSLRIAGLFLAFIVITLLFEKATHYLDTHLKGRTRRGLRHAVHHIEEELLALGLISLLLIVSEEYLLKVCVENDDYIVKEKGKGDRHKRFMSRRLFAEEEDSPCSKSEEPFWSANTIHQTHIFIFLIAVTHVLYATGSILICLWRMRRWKRFEDRPDHRLKELENARLVYGQNAFEYWFWSFWAQFSPSVDESLYMSMRCLFIERMEFPEDFDFLSFVVNTLVEEFAIVVRTDWVMWVFAAIWILAPFSLLISTAVSVLIVLLAGTKLEVVGVKLTQLTYLAYGDRTAAQVRSITAPSTLIKKSVMHVAQRLTRYSNSPSVEERPPNLATQSLSGFGVAASREKETAVVRRVHSFEDRKSAPSSSQSQRKHPPDVANAAEISSDVRQAEIVQDLRDQDARLDNHGRSIVPCCGAIHQGRGGSRSFSERYTLPDSANLFWFKQPQLILKALRFVYFETAMAIAVVSFDQWQSSDFIIKDTNYFGNKFLLMALIIAVGLLCLLHTSFLMLPTYALTMVAGSHCPEALLNIAKKMKIEPVQVMRIENLREESVRAQMNQLNKSFNMGESNGRIEHAENGDSDEKTISSLIGQMYKGRLQRLMSQTSAIEENATSTPAAPGGQSQKADTAPGADLGSQELDRCGQSSGETATVDDEETRGIVAVFGSFEKFLQDLHNAQKGIKQITPAATFNFDCATASYNGRESTLYDTAAINLTWDIIVAHSDRFHGGSR